MSIQDFSFRISWPKLVCSLPILLITLYFVPPLGVVLTIARYFVHGNYRYYRVPAVLLIIGAACLVPRAYELLQINIGDSIPVFQPLIDFRSHQLYPKITDFGRFVSIFSIITLIVSQLLKNVISKISSMIAAATMATPKKSSAANDAREKTPPTMQKDGKSLDPSDQETPHVVKCQNCGKANHIIGTVGTCKACRTPIEWHSHK